MPDITQITEPDESLALPTAADATFEPSLPIHASPAGQRRLVKDIGAHLRKIRGLKVGSVTKRTPEMVAEIIRAPTGWRNVAQHNV